MKLKIQEWTGNDYTSACIPVYSNDAYRELKDYAKELDPEQTLIVVYTHDDFNTHFEAGRKRLKKAKYYHPEWFESGEPQSQLQILYVRNDKDAQRLFKRLEQKALSFAESTYNEDIYDNYGHSYDDSIDNPYTDFSIVLTAYTDDYPDLDPGISDTDVEQFPYFVYEDYNEYEDFPELMALENEVKSGQYPGSWKHTFTRTGYVDDTTGECVLNDDVDITHEQE